MNAFETACRHPLAIVKGNGRLKQPIRRILLIQLGDVGDVVLAIPTIRSLKRHYPQSHLTVAVRKKASGLLQLCPWCDDILSIGEEKSSFQDRIVRHLRFFHSLRRRRFDLALDMRTGTRGALLAFLSGAPDRLGFQALDDPWRNRLFNHLTEPPMDRPRLHMAHYHLLLLDRYGITVDAGWPRLRITAPYRDATDRLLDQVHVPTKLPLIAIQPFSLWRYKEWGTKKFRLLIQWLADCHDVAVLVCGTAAELPRVARMTEGLSTGKVINMAGRTSIALYAALLARCRLFIGCDSAGVHIAAAVETPTATIYGPSSPDSWAPRERGHRVIRKDMECVPCRQKGCRNSGVSLCLEQLGVDDVVKQIEPLMKDIDILGEARSDTPTAKDRQVADAAGS